MWPRGIGQNSDELAIGVLADQKKNSRASGQSSVRDEAYMNLTDTRVPSRRVSESDTLRNLRSTPTPYGGPRAVCPRSHFSFHCRVRCHVRLLNTFAGFPRFNVAWHHWWHSDHAQGGQVLRERRSCRRHRYQGRRLPSRGRRERNFAVYPSWAKLVRTFEVDLGEDLLDLVGDGVLGGEGVAAGLDGDLPVAA